MKVSELKKLLKRNGCRFVKHGKEHDKWYSHITGKYFCIPRHNAKEIKTGTAESVLKEAGIR